jgi:hypothetical protein
MTLMAGKDTQILVDGKAQAAPMGQGASLVAPLKASDRAKVTYTADPSGNLAKRIEITRAP